MFSGINVFRCLPMRICRMNRHIHHAFSYLIHRIKIHLLLPPSSALFWKRGLLISVAANWDLALSQVRFGFGDGKGSEVKDRSGEDGTGFSLFENVGKMIERPGSS